jgi:hypothetical protein
VGVPTDPTVKEEQPLQNGLSQLSNPSHFGANSKTMKASTAAGSQSMTVLHCTGMDYFKIYT